MYKKAISAIDKVLKKGLYIEFKGVRRDESFRPFRDQGPLAVSLYAGPGSSLEDIRVNGSGRKEVYFTLTGENIVNLAREFRSGRAVCNVSSLRASMIHLKEEMYKVIRP